MQAAFIGSHWQLPGTQIPAALKVKSKSISFFLKKTLRTFQVGCEPGAAARNASSIRPSRHMFRAHGHSSVGRKFRRRTLLEKGRAPGVVICSKQRGRVGGQVVGTTKVMWQVQKRGHGTALHQLQQQAMESAHDKNCLHMRTQVHVTLGRLKDGVWGRHPRPCPGLTLY